MTNDKYIIYAKVPTGYQRQSIRAFCMNLKEHGNGSITAQAEFDSEEEAKTYLRGCASALADTQIEYDEMFAEIEQHGQLTYDGCTAKIYTEEEFNWI